MPTKKSRAKKPRIRSCSLNFVRYKTCGGGAYFLGFLGAAVYYIQTSAGVWGGIAGVLKAIVWPAFLVHGLLKFIGA